LPANPVPQPEDVRPVTGLGPGLGHISLDLECSRGHSRSGPVLDEATVGEGQDDLGGPACGQMRIEVRGVAHTDAKSVAGAGSLGVDWRADRGGSGERGARSQEMASGQAQGGAHVWLHGFRVLDRAPDLRLPRQYGTDDERQGSCPPTPSHFSAHSRRACVINPSR
jgi:hypothetical protein